jgi:hypothetical protein
MTMKRIFKITKHSTIDKDFVISGPIELTVDYDDVNHKEQDRLARQLVSILNEHWPTEDQ